ncbi:transposase [Clostridium sp.]|uniref:transposase n=1 Tax=Clostridium sp. TaxID=1506 RepID=UPI003D6CB151
MYSTEDSIYFNDRFIYNPQDNTYICPEGQILVCITKKKDVKERKYANRQACDNCTCKEKCTTSKVGRILTRKTYEEIVDVANKRTK